MGFSRHTTLSSSYFAKPRKPAQFEKRSRATGRVVRTQQRPSPPPTTAASTVGNILDPGWRCTDSVIAHFAFNPTPGFYGFDTVFNLRHLGELYPDCRSETLLQSVSKLGGIVELSIRLDGKGPGAPSTCRLESWHFAVLSAVAMSSSVRLRTASAWGLDAHAYSIFFLAIDLYLRHAAKRG